MPKCQMTQEAKSPSDVEEVIKQIAIQVSRGGSNDNQIIDQIWTNN